MKKFLTSSVWFGLLQPKYSAKILEQLELEVIDGHLFYTSMISLNRIFLEFPVPGKEKTFTYLVQEIVEEIYPQTKEILPFFVSQTKNSGLSKADSLELLTSHFYGIPEILYAGVNDWSSKGWETWQLSLANLLGKAN